MLKKPRPRHLTLLVSVFSVFVLLLSACGAQGTPTSSSSNTGAPHKGGTWVDDIVNEPDSLIPNGSSQTFSNLADEALYTPLFVGDTNGKITPGAATEVPTVQNGGISADTKTWTFHMRPNLVWSDGQPYNADDVDFTWRLWNNPKFGAQSTVGFPLIQSTTISADKLTITFHLSQPFAPFASIWTDGLYAPLPKHHFASVDPSKILKSSDNLNPQVTSGPFTMSESRPGDHYTMVRNPKYYQAAQGLPYLDKFILKVVSSEDTVLKDLQSGAATSSWFLDVSKISAYKAIPNYTVIANPAASNYEMAVFNFKNPILGKDLEVRKAIAMAIDHTALISTARQNQAVPLCTDHGKAFNPGYQADAACPTYDPAAANKLLDQAGWVKGSDGYRSKGGQKLEFMYTTTSGKPWRLADEELIQANLKVIGIKINIKNLQASSYFGTFLPNGQHDIGEFENSYNYDADDASILACNQIPVNGSGGQNYSFYCNKQLDKALLGEEQAGDPAARQQFFNQIHQVELTDYPFVILYSPTDPGVAKNSVHNYLPGPLGASETINVWKWWCDNGTC